MPFNNSWTAETLGENISGCTVICRFNGDSQSFTTHVVGIPYNDFSIVDGVGYFVYCTQYSISSMPDISITSVNVSIFEGWNIVGWYHDYTATAESLGENITGTTVVCMFNAGTQTYTTHVVGIPYNDFVIERGMGLFIYVDRNPPMISNVGDFPDPQYEGCSVNITCTVTDMAGGVDNVRMNITYPDLSTGNYTMLRVGGTTGYYYNATYSQVGVHAYSIWAIDTNNHANVSLGYSFTIEEDITPPVISNVMDTPDPQETGGFVNITCDVTDNTLVDIVMVNITFPDSTTMNVTMNGGSYYYNSSYIQLGTYNYYIWAEDTSGNSNISPGHSFTIQDSSPPIFLNISVSVPIIPEDTDGHPQNNGNIYDEITNVTVNISDESTISWVTINLTSVGWGNNVSMKHITGTDVWYFDVNATNGTNSWDNSTSQYGNHTLIINTSDIHGNWAVSTVNLSVWLNGDVTGGHTVDALDLAYIADEINHQSGIIPLNVADVTGDSNLDQSDLDYLASYIFHPNAVILH